MQLTPAEVEHKLNVLRQHCEAEGRDFNEIEITTHFRPIAPVSAFAGQPAIAAMTFTPEQAIEQIGQLRDLGVQQVIIPATLDYPEMTDLIAAEVMPHFTKQPVAA
jgi:alkanesulfonate monooxygenase SsuD/methylene tetrahydromethanopterin reductase-like flavin-dependent oxidoreductase (luciferase family)